MDSTSLREQELKLKVGGNQSSDQASSNSVSDDCAGNSLNSEAQSEAPSAIPDLGEQYEILSVLGSGGMGTVYKVKDLVNEETFAVKVLKAEVSKDNAAVKRFEQEVKSASKLTHSNLVSVYRHGSTGDGSPFLVMDYYEGADLSANLKEKGQLEPEEAIDLFIQLGSAISHAHQKGVIHRDIKPTNVIISRNEEGLEIPRVVDFGIAKVLPSSNRETLNFTETGEVFGSPEYMSPEQCLGFNLDHKSDIYSFGCLMYETLTGKTPFAGQNPIQLVVKHINEEVPAFPPEAKRSKLARELESIVLKCLEKEPENRFQSMDDLVETLELLKDGKPIPKYTTTRKAKPTLTSAQAYGNFILVAFALLAVQSYVATYYKQIAESTAMLILGALMSIGAYIFCTITFGADRYQTFWQEKPLKDWWQQFFCFSTFLFLSIVGTSLIFTSIAPFYGIDYLAWKHVAEVISITKWSAIISALSMVASGAGYIVLSIDKVVGWKKFMAKQTGILLSLYLACLVLVPNLAARLPVFLGEASTTPVASWLYDKASRIDHSYARPLELLYEQETRNKNWDKALEHINKLIALDDQNPYWFAKRAMLHNTMGNTALALTDIQQAQAIRPLELRFVDAQVQILLKADQPLRALPAIDRALYNDPGSPHFSSLKAAIYARMGRYYDALETLEQISNTKDNKNPFLHLQKAEYYRMLGEKYNATVEFQNSLSTADIWWKDRELMPLVRAYANKHLNQINFSRQDLALAELRGLKKSQLSDMLYSKYSGLNPEW